MEDVHNLFGAMVASDQSAVGVDSFVNMMNEVVGMDDISITMPYESCYEQVECLHPSGVPIQEHINYAQELYKQKNKKEHMPFVMLHYWALLQHNEKWISKNNESPPKRQRSSNSSSPEFDDEQDVDADEDDDKRRGTSPTPSSAVLMRKRTPGRKQEKERLERGEGAIYEEVLQEIIITRKDMEYERKQEKEAKWMELKAIKERKAAYEERKVAIEEKLRVFGKEVLTKKMEQEQNIIFIDMNGLHEKQRAYVDATRWHILASKMGRNI
ncbi:uncharacterized protein LOC133885121 [Phragmites australis]|uniref:uncharacterized protein LOC133885121 n=1 Tax=Phragmites australis TaxID=29695 RepID=UPI002D79330E|nr:uncharacterized protein LOC133885121 [Phragmites australis]